VERYTPEGETKREESDERREVHCLRAILSEQDFEREGGASPRAGFRRTTPRWEKKARPGRAVLEGAVMASEGSEVGISQGDASSWAAMMSSMEASPQGASEQYMWRVTLGCQAKGWPCQGVFCWRRAWGKIPSGIRRRMNSEVAVLSAARRRHS
jgi:hypothetical protein